MVRLAGYDRVGRRRDALFRLPGDNEYPDDHGDEFETDWPDADYTAYGRLSEGRLGTTSNSAANGVINSRMLELCAAMKTQGIIIYTITFQLNSSTTQQLYRDCATADRFLFQLTEQ